MSPDHPNESSPTPRVSAGSDNPSGWRGVWGLFRRQVWDRIAETWDRFQRDDGSLMAAATSFYAGLSLMPLLIVLISALGWFLQTTALGADAKNQFLAAIESEASPLIRRQVEAVLTNLSEGASVSGPLGLVGLLLGGMAIFAQFERAFDRIWNVQAERDLGLVKSIQRILLLRFRAFLMLCGLGLLVIVVFLAGLTISAVETFASQWWPIPTVLGTLTKWGFSLGLNTLIFTLLYRLLPKVDVRWREALAGGVLVAAGWEIGRHVLSAVLLRTNYISGYGTIGSFLAVLLWLYYVSHLLFLGAEFIQTICKRCDVELTDCS
jgi:membrane protein